MLHPLSHKPLIPLHFPIIPESVSGNSVNPARSIAPAVFQGGVALEQLWVFIVGPFVGAAIAAGIWKIIGGEEK